MTIKNRITLSAIPLLLCLGLSAPARATGMDYQGLEVRGGYVAPDFFEPGPSVGFSLELGDERDEWRLYPSVFYTQSSVEIPAIPPFVPAADLDFDVLALGVEGRYFTLSPDAGWYFGGGLYYLNADLESGLGTIHVSSSQLQGVAGWALSSALRVELRYATEFDHIGAFVVLRFAASE